MIIVTIAVLFAVADIAVSKVHAHECATHQHYLATLPDYYLTNPQFDACIKLMDLAEDDFQTIDNQGRMYLNNVTTN